MSDKKTTASGFGCFGMILSAVLSAALNHSFWWGLLHFLLGWIYVLYALLFRAKEIIPALDGFFL